MRAVALSILVACSDPATPISNGYAVFDRIPNAFMVTMEGGPHVIWGRGSACPDKIVFGLMLDGRAGEVDPVVVADGLPGTLDAIHEDTRRIKRVATSSTNARIGSDKPA